VQRVSQAAVHVGERETGRIGPGLLVLLGAGEGDGEEDVRYVAEKVAGLRIFEDAAGKLNLSVEDTGGAVLVVSQFTLYGDCRKGRRPSFVKALEPVAAAALVERCVALLRARGLPVATGEFGAMMKVSLVNDGPVTLLVDSGRAL
jgi:D-tyrosyl-tRNA(Tyr) deacylase